MKPDNITDEKWDETRQLALGVLRTQANADMPREQVILDAFHAGVCGIDSVEVRDQVIAVCKSIRQDLDLERGVRKVAGWHLEALTAIQEALAREEVPA